jgi:CysZ protein
VEGLGVLRRERSLWKLASVPFLLCAVALLATFAGVVTHVGELHAFASGWLPSLEAHAWYAWFWVAPGRVVLWLAGLLLFAGLAGVIMVAALLLANLLASPFLDALARRVEALVTGEAEEATTEGWLAPVREGGRAALEELRRAAFFLAVQLGLFLVGLLPGGQVVAAPAMVLVAVLFLPLDYASYTLDRRRVTFREKRRWVLARIPLMLGYGSAAFVTCLIPGLNLLAMPVLVVGGTLLALRHPPSGGE